MSYGKILNYITIGLFAISLIILGFFAFGGELPDQQYSTPVYTSLMLNWAYILTGVAIVAALIFPIGRLFVRPKEAMKSFLGIGGLVIIFLIGYALADGTPLNIPGYSGPDNIPGTLVLTDTIIYAMYILIFATIGAIIATEVIKKFR